MNRWLVAKPVTPKYATAIAVTVAAILVASSCSSSRPQTGRVEPPTVVTVVVTATPEPATPTPVPPPTTPVLGTETATAAGNAETVVGEARRQLADLTTVEAFDAPFPYNRDDYDSDGWADADSDCLNTRHEVLAVESIVPPTIEDCRVVAGSWLDWITGETLNTPAEATIDHVVALAHAHRAGAWAWSPATKQAFANDLDEPSSLNVASGPSNQTKADASPAEWRPPDRESWCGYAITWIRVKARWRLNVTGLEVAALQDMLNTCNEPATERFGADFTASVAAADVVIAPPTPTPFPPTPIPDSSPDATLVIIGCDARAEIVTIANPATTPRSLAGWRLHDEGNKHSYSFPQLIVAPGGTIRVLTGDANPTGTDLFWKPQNVWNNDGDIAFLLDPSGISIAEQRCET